MAHPHARPRRRGGTPLRDAQAHQRPGCPAGGVGGAGREDRGSSAGIKKRRTSQRRRRLKRSRSLAGPRLVEREAERDRKSTRLNSSHVRISYAVFCLKKKKEKKNSTQ